MRPLLDQLITLSGSNPQAFATLLNNHTHEITPHLAEEAHERFKQALQGQQAGYAAASAYVASILFSSLKQPYEGLKNYIHYLQVRYMAASTEEAYQAIRDEGTTSIANAELISAFDLAFALGTLVANCGYFASDAQKVSAQKEFWLRLTLNDLVVASGYGPHANRDDLEQFVSLLTGFSEAFTMLVPSPSPSIGLRLRQLTLAVEQVVPIDFKFTMVSDTDKTVASARWLALLSYRYGNATLAKRRLEFATGGK